MTLKKAGLIILLAVCAIELLLAVYGVPVAHLPMILGLGALSLLALAVIGLFVLIAYRTHVNARDRQYERATYLAMFQETQQTHRHTIAIMGYINAQQADLVDRMINAGGELRQLRTGGYAAMLNGQVVPVSDEQAKYWVEGPQPQESHLLPG